MFRENSQILTNFIMSMNVRNNYGAEYEKQVQKNYTYSQLTVI